MKRLIIIILLIIIAYLLLEKPIISVYFNTQKDEKNTNGSANVQSDINALKEDFALNKELTINEEQLATIAQNLEVPWEIVKLAENDFLVTQRNGELLRIKNNPVVIAKIEGVSSIGEGGLLGLVLHPDFSTNNYIYLYSTYNEGLQILNRVERYTLSGTTLKDRTTVIDNIKGSTNHDGGRIAFGPDAKLYVTTGDALEPNLSQDTNSLSGKILRINDDGSIPLDNPFGNAVYSLGHRNPQGLAWDSQGNLWSTEHGPSGLSSGFDELNKIEKGKNYGWPLYKGLEKAEGFEPAVLTSGADDTWAPAGLTYFGNSLFFTGLRGQALYRVDLDSASPTLETYFKNSFGRLRAIVADENGLYFSTSNKDGRGSPTELDDRIFYLKLVEK